MMVLFFFRIILSIMAARAVPYIYNNVSLYDIKQTTGIAFTSLQPSDGIGTSVKSIGDFNDDGYDDILISAMQTNLQHGVVYIIFGTKNGLSNMTLTPNMAQNPGLIIYGANSGDIFGFASDYAGDVNGDGIGDIVVSAGSAKQAAGIVYVFYGGKNLPPIIDLKQGLNPSQGFAIIGLNQLDLVGYSVSRAGDVNKDGLDDIIIGAPGCLSQAGIACVVFGKKGTRSNVTLAYSGGDPSEGFVILGIAIQDLLGYSVGALGDVNGDAIDDVIVGASGTNAETGAAYVIFGKENHIFETIDLKQGLNQSQGIVLMGGTASGHFGIVVGGAGEFNNDGIKDILVTSYFENNYAGAAYLIYGAKNLANITFTPSLVLDPNTGIKINGVNQIGTFGISMSRAGDINKDGIDDILIGAQQANNLYGAVYVFFGSQNPVNLNLNDGLSHQQGFVINGLKYYDLLGSGVSGAGDMNQDGMDDILIAGYGGSSRPGFAYLLFSPRKLFSAKNSDCYLVICSEKCLNCTATWKCLACETGTELVNGYCVGNYFSLLFTLTFLT